MTKPKRKDPLPVDLERTRQRFERWRGTRKHRSRIPGSLWAAAAKMAKRHGINRTAKALRVGYYSLKERADEAEACSAEPGSDAKPTFLELAAPRYYEHLRMHSGVGRGHGK